MRTAGGYDSDRMLKRGVHQTESVAFQMMLQLIRSVILMSLCWNSTSPQSTSIGSVCRAAAHVLSSRRDACGCARIFVISHSITALSASEHASTISEPPIKMHVHTWAYGDDVVYVMRVSEPVSSARSAEC